MTRQEVGSHRLGWCALVIVWSAVFAAPHLYWAVGGRAGLGDQAGAADAALATGWFAAYNLAAAVAALAVVVAVAGLAAGRVHGRARRILLAAARVAAVLLLLRGVLGLALLAVEQLNGAGGSTPAVLIAIEPWFVVGGIAFGGLARAWRGGRSG